jgi:hypothetical protein
MMLRSEKPPTFGVRHELRLTKKGHAENTASTSQKVVLALELVGAHLEGLLLREQEVQVRRLKDEHAVPGCWRAPHIGHDGRFWQSSSEAASHYAPPLTSPKTANYKNSYHAMNERSRL